MCLSLAEWARATFFASATHLASTALSASHSCLPSLLCISKISSILARFGLPVLYMHLPSLFMKSRKGLTLESGTWVPRALSSLKDWRGGLGGV